MLRILKCCEQGNALIEHNSAGSYGLVLINALVAINSRNSRQTGSNRVSSGSPVIREWRDQPTCGYLFIVRAQWEGVFIDSLTIHANLHGSGKEDQFHYRFNLGSHFLSRNAVGSLVPQAALRRDGPRRRGCKQFGIGARCDRVLRGTFLKHTFHDGDD